ncbi:MAG TPA: enolase C-terminal domain-like protein [Candidatus Hydrogenedentes bacterium]|jgi:L-alanine-DL-glutamate epimerase-like enolase superfamily enzyme|nr:enolase C-terminal domain-like protein [FCB group bacterium]NLT61980.1 mandelate racemase [Candidatus Hydrogenedentota bacterium]HNZ20205.1 enolase C-terminal domain-like protein [Candidatus Hydrogenedentota bacterium]HOH35620.1 enolase C-terminal domain-like protein [Candidatus Hydrogenedentota bacterium]HPA05217.1 enolase C-terminal domain-like protein [Candidatus Hydrogenedentota bacterium]
MKTTRRGFLKALSGGLAGITLARDAPAGASRSVTIASIEVIPVWYPTVMRFKFFEGPTGYGRASAVVKITADDGTVGWGESIPSPRWSYETLESVTTTIDLYLRPVLLGRNPFDLNALHAAMNREIANSFSTGAPIAKAGVDTALHDLIGKALNCTLAELWGRTVPDALTLSWTLNPRTLNEVEPLLLKGREAGYEHFNVKLGPEPAFDLEMCRIVKRLAPEGFLWGDANGAYDVTTALTLAPKLAEAGLDVFEQPLPANRITGYQALRRQGAVPIILDEGVVSPDDLVEFIKLECCDGVAMKPTRCAGLLPARREIALLEDAGLLFLGSGLTEPDIALAASALLYGAHGLRYPAALNGPQFLGESVLAEPLRVEQGKLRLPTGPGLGIQVDEVKLRDLAERSKHSA